jgi:hypothetical protein
VFKAAKIHRLAPLPPLTAGTHTVSVTAYDAAGNARIVSLTFTIRPTLGGIMAAINDGASRVYMTAAEKTTLVNALNAVISAGQQRQEQDEDVHQRHPVGDLGTAHHGVPGTAPELGERCRQPDVTRASSPSA